MSHVGARDCVVRIEQLTESRSAAKYPVETWATLATVFMGKRDAGGRERVVVEQIAGESDQAFITYYRPDMDPDTIDVPKRRRLVFRGRTYDIVTARPIGFRQDIELVTRASSRVA